MCVHICTHMCICMHTRTHVYIYSSYIRIYIQEIYINHIWHIYHIWHISLLLTGVIFLKVGCSDKQQNSLRLAPSWVWAGRPECALGPVSCLQADRGTEATEREGQTVCSPLKRWYFSTTGVDIAISRIVSLNNISVGDRNSQVAMRNPIFSSLPICFF